MIDRAANRAKDAALWNDADWPSVARFLGPNADRFAAVWERARAKVIAGKPAMVAGWSWPALIFGFAWFLYRKQWAIGAVLIVVPMLIGYFFSSAGMGGGVAIVMAIYGKSFVLHDAVVKIGRIRAAGGDDGAIEAAGGVSTLGGLVGGLLWALSIAGAVISLTTTAG